VTGNAPSLAARWAVQAVAKAGSIGIVGVCSPEFDAYPIGQAMSAAIRDALQALAAGQLTVPIDSAVPLEQVNEAFERIQQRRVRGKLVLDSQA